MLLASQLGKGQETLDLLYDMTYEQGLNISLPDVLAQAAQELALPDFVPDYLASGEGYLEVRPISPVTTQLLPVNCA
eukprot:7746360-Pyramimonas_sp.AAC.1